MIDNVKIGDNVLCKRDRVVKRFVDDNIVDITTFISGVTYKVIDIIVYTEEVDLVIRCDKNGSIKNEMFHLSGHNSFSIPVFANYFYTTSEYRDIKLSSIIG